MRGKSNFALSILSVRPPHGQEQRALAGRPAQHNAHRIFIEYAYEVLVDGTRVI